MPRKAADVLSHYFATRASMSWVTSGRAGPASEEENFSPWYCAGLWLAVKVDGAIELAAHDFVGDGGSGRERLAEESLDFVLLQNFHGKLRKFFRVKTRIVAHHTVGFFSLGINMVRDRRSPPGER